MKISELKRFDAAEDLDTDEDRALFLAEAIDGCDDPRVFAHALATVARSRNWPDLAQACAGVNDLPLAALRAVLAELGLEITFRAKRAPA